MQAIDRDAVVYPDSDGEPMADNTLQFQWIVVLKENLDAVLPDFVAGDLLWYPVEGDNRTRRAPDVLVAFGRPKGHRGSYRQWEEGGVAPQVVMEVLSPRNTLVEMMGKLDFYRLHGAREFYVVDPANHELAVWLDAGEGDGLTHVERGERFTSPLLGITFTVNGELQVFHADGRRFETFAEIMAARAAAGAERDAAQAERDAAQAGRDAAQGERDAAQAERDAAVAEVEALRAQLRAAGVDPDA